MLSADHVDAHITVFDQAHKVIKVRGGGGGGGGGGEPAAQHKSEVDDDIYIHIL